MTHCLGVLVHKSKWSETSLLVTWLTDQYGTLRMLARGALRPGSPFAGKLDLFHRGEISYVASRSGTLHTLREVHLHRTFTSSSYPTLALTSYIAELSAAVAPPMQPCPELHDLLLRALDHLESHPASRRALEHFEKETSRLLGVHDATGRTPPHAALAQLCGQLPATRGAALKALGISNG